MDPFRRNINHTNIIIIIVCSPLNKHICPVGKISDAVKSRSMTVAPMITTPPTTCFRDTIVRSGGQASE